MIHLAAAIRDEPHARVEELNGLATARLLRAAERAGVERFVFFSALGASELQRTRFFRAKALAEEAVAASPLKTAIFAPSIVYDPGDRWVRLLKRLALLPVIPISGSGRSRLPADLGGRRGALRDRRRSSATSRTPATSSPALRSSPTTRSPSRWPARRGGSGHSCTCRSASCT